MTKESKAIAKLNKKYSKLSWEAVLKDVKSLVLQGLPAFFILFILRNLLAESEYKLKRESAKFFRYSIYAYGAHKRRRCDRLIVVAFKLIDQDFDTNFINLIRKSVKVTLNDSNKRPEQSNKIFEAIKILDITKCDATGWYQLSRGLFSLGYFRAAWFAREISLDLSISESLIPSATPTTLQRGIEAQLERRKFSDADVAIRSSNSKISAFRMSKFVEYLAMMQDMEHLFSDDLTLTDQSAFKVFSSLISGKDVVLVGTGSPSGDFGYEIDSADTVIRVKFTGVENLPDFNYHGSRCEISHFNNLKPLLEIFANKKEKNFLEDLKLVLSSDTISVMIGDIPVFNPYFEIPIYRTTATSGIRSLKLALLGKPNSLKIYGFDFYSKKEQYACNSLNFYKTSGWMLGEPNFNSAIPEQDRRRLSVSSSFGAHDPVSNFCFAQNLYKAGLFDIEPFGKSILELTPYQYVERLEEMLGDW